MAKMQGITGKLSGRMGNAVFRVRRGTQVVAQYNPVVENPNTRGQQEGRGKFKLVSQLGAILGSELGMMRTGSVSARNKFTKINYPVIDIAQNTATVNLRNLKLTESSVFCPQNTATLDDLKLSVELMSSPMMPERAAGGGNKKVKHVVLVGFGTLATTERPARVIASQEVDISVANPNGQYTFDLANANLTGHFTITVLSFVIEESVTGGMTKYENMMSAEGVASIAIDQSLRNGDVTVTDTVGVDVNS